MKNRVEFKSQIIYRYLKYEVQQPNSLEHGGLEKRGEVLNIKDNESSIFKNNEEEYGDNDDDKKGESFLVCKPLWTLLSLQGDC